MISGYVNLKRTGSNHKGLCPFHSEKTPSFVVSEGKQIFHCFGCNMGGNALKFYMEIESKSFPEAVRDLAERYGVEIEERMVSKEEEARRKSYKRYLAINKLAAEYFKHELHKSKGGREALDYLRKRKLDDELIGSFNLGWAPDDWQSLKNMMNSKKVSDQELYALGLLSKNQESGRYFDKFRGRIIFPIQDVNNNFIAFGGRLIADGQPKYLNSPDTPVYNKGHHLYGLNQAKLEIRNKDWSLLVEGYMDVLICHQFGIRNAVASLGTALTSDQARLLQRYSIDCKLAYDGDDAGRQAAIRAFGILAEAGMKVEALQFPAGADPDDYLQKEGAEKFGQLLEKALHPIIFRLDFLLPKGEISLSEKNKILAELAPDLFKVKSTIMKDYLIREISARLSIQEDLIRSELNLLYRSRRGQAKIQPPEEKKARRKPVHYNKEYSFILQKIKEKPELAEKAEELGGQDLFPGQLKEVYEIFTNGSNYDIIKNPGNTHEDLISGIMLQEFDYENDEKAFFEILTKMVCLKLDRECEDKQKQLIESEKRDDVQEMEALLLEINEIIKNKDRIRKGLFS